MPRRFAASKAAWAVVLAIVVAGVTGCASAKPAAQAPASSAPASSTATAGYWPTLNGINAKLAAAPQGNVVPDYTTEQITLHTILAGNVTASRVPADKFPAS